MLPFTSVTDGLRQAWLGAPAPVVGETSQRSEAL